VREHRAARPAVSFGLLHDGVTDMEIVARRRPGAHVRAPLPAWSDPASCLVRPRQRRTRRHRPFGGGGNRPKVLSPAGV